MRLPRWPLWPLALGAEAAARVTGREPMLTLDGLRMAGHRMYFSSAKAEAGAGLPRAALAGGGGGCRRLVPRAGDAAAVTALLVGLAACLAWAVLLFGRGMFWLARDDDRDAAALPDPAAWPSVTAIVPARDEAATIGATVASLLAQDYPGAFRLVVVDDRSTDGTGDLARAAAAGDPRLMVVRGGARAPGWTGKLWALEQGLRAVPEAPRTTCCSPMPISATRRTACGCWWRAAPIARRRSGVPRSPSWPGCAARARPSAG